jgi:hypothetical protein
MPAAAQPPPDLPNMPDVGPRLSDYLRRFSLWCRQGFADRLQANEALPGVLLLASDAPANAPKVFMLQVKSDGTVVTTAMALGSGRP